MKKGQMALELGNFLDTQLPDTPILKATEATLERLQEQGLINEAHAAQVQLITDVARAVGVGLAFPRVSVATTTLVRELRELLEGLPKEAAEETSALEQLMLKAVPA